MTASNLIAALQSPEKLADLFPGKSWSAARAQYRVALRRELISENMVANIACKAAPEMIDQRTGRTLKPSAQDALLAAGMTYERRGSALDGTATQGWVLPVA